MASTDPGFQALEDFDTAAEKQLSPELRQILEHVAKTNALPYPWESFKPFLLWSIDQVIMELAGPGGLDDNMSADKRILLDTLRDFEGAPFTLQRICELILNARNQYRRVDKLMRGFEKLVRVTSTLPSTEVLLVPLAVIDTQHALHQQAMETQAMEAQLMEAHVLENQVLAAGGVAMDAQTVEPVVEATPTEEQPASMDATAGEAVTETPEAQTASASTERGDGVVMDTGAEEGPEPMDTT